MMHGFLRFTLVGVLLALVLCPILVHAEDDPIVQADNLYKQRFDLNNVITAIDLLAKFIEKEPGNYDALWRLARLHWYRGDRTPAPKKGEENTRLLLFEKGRGYAEQAVKANDGGIDGHYWLAALIGNYGKERGVLKSLFLVPSMRKEIDRCLQIDNTYADAHYISALLLWEVPGIAGGNKKKAQEEARLATVYDPNAIDHWMTYGQYASGNKDYATARMALGKALSLPDDPEDPISSQEDKATAREELKKIEGKG